MCSKELTNDGTQLAHEACWLVDSKIWQPRDIRKIHLQSRTMAYESISGNGIVCFTDIGPVVEDKIVYVPCNFSEGYFFFQ